MSKPNHANDISNSLLLKIAVARVNKTKVQPISYLKPKQVMCLKFAVEKSRDTLAVLATGYGKSLIFEILPVYSEIYHSYHKSCQEVCKFRAVIISPLNAIITQQKQVLGGNAYIVGELFLLV